MFVGLHLLGQQGGFGAVRDGTDVVGFGMPLQHAACAIGEGLLDIEGELAEWTAFHVDALVEQGLRADGHHLVVVDGAVVVAQHYANLLLRGGEDFDFHFSFAGRLDVHHEVFRCLLHHTQFTVGHEILREAFLLVGHEPTEVGLVLGIHAGHQLDVGTEALTVEMPP